MSRIFGKADILGVKDREPVPVSVPEWAVDGEAPVVLIRRINGKERREFNKLISGKDDDAEIESIAFAYFACDEAGQPLFTQEDAGEIAEKFGGAVARVARRALFSNGYGKDSAEAHEKNS